MYYVLQYVMYVCVCYIIKCARIDAIILTLSLSLFAIVFFGHMCVCAFVYAGTRRWSVRCVCVLREFFKKFAMQTFPKGGVRLLLGFCIFQ